MLVKIFNMLLNYALIYIHEKFLEAIHYKVLKGIVTSDKWNCGLGVKQSLLSGYSFSLFDFFFYLVCSSFHYMKINKIQLFTHYI